MVDGFTENADDRRRVTLNTVAARYFETLSTPFIVGRDFAPEDEGASRVAIVNQAMARYYFGTRSPLGHTFTIEGQARPLAIVGVVGDAKYWDLHETPPRTIYMNAFQGSGPWIFVLRTDVRQRPSFPRCEASSATRCRMCRSGRIHDAGEQVDASILPSG
jgi:hypothetical protein